MGVFSLFSYFLAARENRKPSYFFLPYNCNKEANLLIHDDNSCTINALRVQSCTLNSEFPLLFTCHRVLVG